ncbi:MAG: hypothetical protein BWX98_02268 [Candidatus Aminicenantes bacterium ADurb.Bin147]|nr:MAG: hypothetical protein BWX98_02268 [Candidatus Aminicenantes bacterium ADurb.Bin147]
MIGPLLTAAGIVFLYMTGLCVLALVRKNYSIVDAGWGPGFVLAAAALFLRDPDFSPARLLMTALITLWAARLSFHILRRNAGKPEDFRYAAMRKRWGKAAPLKSYLFIFLFQGAVMLLVSSPLTAVFLSPARPLSILDAAGTAVFLAGFLFETVADRQLAAHIRDSGNKKMLMTRGLWSLSRHPNHFGEATLWWGLGLIALSSRYGWAGLIGPAVITFFLRFVSGVPLLEKKYAGRPDWEEYKKKTPVFFPRLPGA